jgi:hypothetical protein
VRRDRRRTELVLAVRNLLATGTYCEERRQVDEADLVQRARSDCSECACRALRLLCLLRQKRPPESRRPLQSQRQIQRQDRQSKSSAVLRWGGSAARPYRFKNKVKSARLKLAVALRSDAEGYQGESLPLRGSDSQAAPLPTICGVASCIWADTKDLFRSGVFLTARRSRLAGNRRNTLTCRTVGAGSGHAWLLNRDGLRSCNFPWRWRGKAWSPVDL